MTSCWRGLLVEKEEYFFPGWKLSRINVGSAYLLSDGNNYTAGQYIDGRVYIHVGKVKIFGKQLSASVCHNWKI
jgi:hypothetical protein